MKGRWLGWLGVWMLGVTTWAWGGEPTTQPHGKKVAPTSRTTTRAPVHQWLASDLEAAIRAAKDSHPILVEIYADWCSPCNQLNHEVLHTEAGQELLREAVGVRFDFESKAGKEITSRYGVLHLPTMLVLNPKGREIGRVEGYPGRIEFVQAIQDAMRGNVSLRQLKKRWEVGKANRQALLDYASALLVRGQVKRAKALLVPVMKAKDALSVSAHRVWGRWLLRVKRDYPRATAHFLRSMKHFDGTRSAGGFLYWSAKGYQLQGKEKEAMALFDGWIARSKGAAKLMPLRYKADFQVHYKYDAAKTEALIRRVIQFAPNNAWLYYLLAQVRLRQHDPEGARIAIAFARQKSPKSAIYINFERRLPTPKP